MIAHVISLNDYPEAVVIDDEAQAIKEKNRLEKERLQVNSGVQGPVYWHIKSVPVINSNA